jgi:molybdenum cofactor cytidylyltransferase
VALVNQVRDEATLACAHQIATLAKGHPRLDRVLLAAVATDEPVLESWRRVSAVVLAAGASTRLGRPKQLLPVATHTMIEHVLGAVKAASLDEVVVVLGSSAAQIAEHVPTGCRVVLNPNWETGVASSIRAGLAAVDPRSEAVLFVQADQPYLSCAVLERILHAYYGSTKAIVVPTYQGRSGSPVLFDRSLFSELATLHGDVGGREVIAGSANQVLQVEMESGQAFLDIDTLADYERFLQQTGVPITHQKES